MSMLKITVFIVLVVISGMSVAGVPNLNNSQVIKRYAELAYHIATIITNHHDMLGNVPADTVSKCRRSGTKSQHAIGYTIINYNFNKCHESGGDRLPVINGMMIENLINDDVSVVESRNITMAFSNSRKGYTVNGKLQEGNGVTNIDDVKFTYNLRHGTWEHTVTSLKYKKIYPYDENIKTEEMFSISLSGQPYGSLTANTLEPIKMGTGNDFGKILSGKFELLISNRKFVITFVKPREIMVEETGKKSRRVDWYGDPTIIFSDIPYELKH